MAQRERLLRFYQKYNGDKLHEIDGVLERFKGKEAALFTALVKKYGPEPSADEDLSTPAAAAAAPATTVPAASTSGGKKSKKKGKQATAAAATDKSAANASASVITDLNHARLLAFYERYNPDKVDDVPSVLVKYKGKEAALFTALVKKYGPEPGDSDDDDDDEDDEDDDDDDDDDEEDASEEKTPVAADGADEVTDDTTTATSSTSSMFKHVEYCPVDSLPAEYCEYGPLFNDTKPWLAEHCPGLWLSKYNRTIEDFLDAERQIAAGVEGISLMAEGKEKTVKRKGKKKVEEFKSRANAVVTITKSARKGRKRLTFVTGLEDFDSVNIKDACKSLGKRFACSSSLSKTDAGKQQIQLQGDCVTDLLDVLPELFGIADDRIRVVDEPIKGKK